MLVRPTHGELVASERLKEQLERQLAYLERSCASYDAGHLDEAVRMATTMRVLLHDTASSTSLLRHLGRKDVHLATTAPLEVIAPNVLAMEVLVTFTTRGLGPKSHARDIRGFLPAEEWWSQIVHIMGKDVRLTRRNIVLFAANQDGGAHVDEKLSAQGKRLLEGSWTRISGVHGTGERRSEQLRDHHFVMLRTMAFELLNSPELRGLAA